LLISTLFPQTQWLKERTTNSTCISLSTSSAEMPLNLLKHKSYHVHSARNVARVQRDEAVAAERAKVERAYLKREKLAALRGPASSGSDSGNKATDQPAKDNYIDLHDFGAFELEELKHLHEDGPSDHRRRHKEPDQNSIASSINFNHSNSSHSYSGKNSNRDVKFDYGENGSVVSLLLCQNYQNAARAGSSHDNISSAMTPNLSHSGYQESKQNHKLQGDLCNTRSKTELDPLAGMLRGIAATEAYERERGKSHRPAAKHRERESKRTRRHINERSKYKDRDRDEHRVHKSHHGRHCKSSNSQRHVSGHRSERDISSRGKRS
jgi:hypothetical protein